MNNAIFEEIFTNDRRIIGDALLQARLTLLANIGPEYQEISEVAQMDPSLKQHLTDIAEAIRGR